MIIFISLLFIDINIKKLAYINRNYPSFPDIKLSTKEYYDFQISSNTNICNCNTFPTPLFCMELTTSDVKICANNIWEDATSTVETIENFGITGYDNRRVPSLDSSLTLEDDLTFCVHRVDGDIYCYDITTNSPIEEFCSGFFQGFYKLEGTDYQVLPDYFKKGWTLEFYMMQQDPNLGCPCAKSKLNDQYPNNSGIFYYYGTRAENKFCSLKEHLLGYEVQSGLTFLESVIKDVSHITPPDGVNPFLFFNCPSLTEYLATATGTTFVLPDCCDGLAYNALAFRVTPEGKIGYRYLGTTGSCIDGKFEETLHVYERYSDEEIFKPLEYHQVDIKFESYDYHECKPNKLTYGVLSIYVDGFLKLREYDFPNIIPYAFDDLSSKQMGVPYNISIGGGTQGLLEMQSGTTTEYSVCDYSFYLKKNQKLKGIIVNDVTYMTPEDYIYTQQNEILTFLNSHLPNKFGIIDVKETSNYIEFTIKLSVDILNNVLYSIEIDTSNENDCCNPNLPSYGQGEPKKTNCFSFETDNVSCGILEENFAGTFIGVILTFCLFDKPLTLSEIRCDTNLY